MPQFEVDRDLKPIAFSVADAAKYISISRSSLYELNNRGVITFIKVGRRTLVPRVELDRLLEPSGRREGSHGR
jgi:excisionase family DNA binding protein